MILDRLSPREVATSATLIGVFVLAACNSPQPVDTQPGIGPIDGKAVPSGLHSNVTVNLSSINHISAVAPVQTEGTQLSSISNSPGLQTTDISSHETQVSFFQNLVKEITFDETAYSGDPPVVKLPPEQKLLNEQKVRMILADEASRLVDLGYSSDEVSRIIRYLHVIFVGSTDRHMDIPSESQTERLLINIIDLDAARHEFIHQLFVDFKSDKLNTSLIKEALVFATEAQVLGVSTDSLGPGNSPFYGATCKVAPDLSVAHYRNAAKALDNVDASLRKVAKIKNAPLLSFIMNNAYINFANKIPGQSRWGHSMPDTFMFQEIATAMGVKSQDVQKAFLAQSLFACK